MNLTKNFTLQELTASDWAARHGVDNTPPAASVPRALTAAPAKCQRACHGGRW